MERKRNYPPISHVEIRENQLKTLNLDVFVSVQEKGMKHNKKERMHVCTFL